MRRKWLAMTAMAVLSLWAVPSSSVATGTCSSRVAPSKAGGCARQAGMPAAHLAFISPNPETQPPLHGTNPHGMGTVAVVQINPDPARPYANDPTGKANNESIVVGRSLGEQRADGTYHGHITIAALFGNEILGVDTNPGETKGGPLTAAQQNLLTPLCQSSGNSICLSAVTATSATTATGSTNHFEATHVTLGGPSAVDTGAASSDGNISQSGGCQTATGDSQVANVNVGGMVLANLIKSSTVSNAGSCGGAAPQTDTSSVLSLGGTGVPLPAPGCANGTPNTVTGVPTLAPVVCNADDSQPGSTNQPQASSPYGVREALDVFVLATGNLSAVKTTTGAAESLAVAPATAPAPTPTPTPTPTLTPCNVGGDNDCATSNPNGPKLPEGGTIDHSRDCSESVENTSGCGGKRGNHSTGGHRCNTGGDNDCVSGNGPFGASIPENGAQDHGRDCAEGVSDGSGACAAGAAPIQTRATLPFTGLDVLPIGLAGLVLLGSGLLLRRRLDSTP